jgi:hypothetical protein
MGLALSGMGYCLALACESLMGNMAAGPNWITLMMKQFTKVLEQAMFIGGIFGSSEGFFECRKPMKWLRTLTHNTPRQ